MISLSTSTLAPTGATVRLPVVANTATGEPSTWGEDVVTVGGNLYLYGSSPQKSDGDARTVIARVPTASVRDTSAWRYWTGSNWSANQAAATPLIDDQGAPLPYLLSPLVHGGRIVSLGADEFTQADLLRWVAAGAPTSPNVVGGVAVNTPEANQPCGTNGIRVVYSVHPHVGTPADENLWSYSNNCYDPGGAGTKVAAQYRPRFVNLNLGSAPNACPVRSLDDSRKIVRAVYDDTVGYAPDPSGLEYWANEIRTNDPCRTRLVETMVRHPDHLEDLVQGMYVRYLGRAASPEEQAYWAQRLRDGVDTWAEMARVVLGSDEYLAHREGSNVKFVESLYDVVLDDPVDATGRDYWVGKINSGTTRGAVAWQFLQGPAGRALRTDALALDLLEAPLDPARKTHWRGVLSASSGDDIGVTGALMLLDPYADAAVTP